MKKNFIIVLMSFILLGAGAGFNQTQNFTNAQPAAKTAPKTTVQTSQAPIAVSSLEVVKNPSAYLNKTVKIKAVFDKFSTLGLDYAPALKKSEEYIGFLIRRDDVTDHTVPLSEMKLFLKRPVAEKYIDLESGDKIEFEGKVFSTALSDPWIDVTKFTVISSKKPIKVE